MKLWHGIHSQLKYICSWPPQTNDCFYTLPMNESANGRKGEDQQYLMFYKQKVGNGSGDLTSSSTRIDDQRKLMQLWRQQEVDEDYQSILFRYFDRAQNRTEQHSLMQTELRHTYQRDSHFFKIMRLMQERQKTLSKLEVETEALQRFKNEPGEPNLQPACMLVDHLRKVYLLIAEQIHQMFNQFGHPKDTGVGFSFLSVFEEFQEDVKFLKDSLLKFYMPFSAGFDPLFLELSQRLRKCYARESLVYDRNVEELINLNASYLYRLLRAHQRMLEAISIGQKRQKQPSPYYQPNPSPNKARNILNQISQQQSPPVSPQITQRFQLSRLMRQDTEKVTSKRKHTPKNIESVEEYAIWSPSIRKKETSDIGIQMQAPQLNINNNNITIPKQFRQEKDMSLPSKQEHIISKVNRSPQIEEVFHNRIIKTPKKTSNSPKNHLPEIEEGKHLHFIRKIQQPSQRLTILQSDSKNSHRRAHTHGNTTKEHSARPHQSLPKLKNSREKVNSGTQQECDCRKRYRQRHCEHQTVELTEEELQKRRRIIIKQIQIKYKALAQRQIRHQLSKLGDLTYHRLKHQQLSRPDRTQKSPTS